MTSFGRSSSSTNPHRLRKFGIVWYGFPSKLMNASAQFILYLSLQLKPATRMSKFPGTGWGFRDNTCNIQVRQRFLLSLVWFCHIQIYRVRIRIRAPQQQPKKTRYRIKNQNSKPQNRIQNQASKIPNPKIHQNPRSRIQNPDQKASKRVCPTSVSARSSAQQLRPQRLKHLNPLWPFILMCCLPNVFLVIKAAVLYMEFWFMTGLPQESRQFFVFCKFTSTVSKMSSWKSPKKCAKFGS